jgi:hypothetical protein
MADVSKYTGLITSEHADKPKFNAMVSAVAQCFVDQQNALGTFIPSFDLDEAVGDQLDTLGAWVGISRRVRTPLTGVYFSFDMAGVGFDQGVWQGPFDPSTGITLLDDDTYRLLIRAKIGANHWDGTLASSAAILNLIFQGGTTPRHLTATNEQFGVGNGVAGAFQLTVAGVPVYKNINVASICRNDWQGTQQLYPTSRTNTVTNSATISSGSLTNLTRTTTTGTAPDGSASYSTLTVVTATTSPQISVPRNSTAIFADPAGGYNFSTSVQDVSAGFVGFQANQNDSGNALIAASCINFDMAHGVWGGEFAVGANPLNGFSNLSAQLVNGWWRLSWRFTPLPNAAIVSPFIGVPNSLTARGGALGTSINVFGVQNCGGKYIATTSSNVTVTDYALSATGLVTPSSKPASGAVLTWNGSGDAYPSGTQVFIEDNQDMSITFGVAGTIPSALFLALLSGGYIPIKPEGVMVRDYVVTSVTGNPIFGFDMENMFVSGFDVGAWGSPL